MCELPHGTALGLVRRCNPQAEANRPPADAQRLRTTVRPMHGEAT